MTITTCYNCGGSLGYEVTDEQQEEMLTLIQGVQPLATPDSIAPACQACIDSMRGMPGVMSCNISTKPN